MSSTLTETAVFTSSTIVPSDGDEAVAASVNNAFQVLADRTQALLALCNGTLRGGYLTVGTNQVVVSPVRDLIVGGVYGSNAVQTTLTLPSLSSGTWYYVYAYPDGSGGVSFEVSTTAPDNSGTTGDGGAMWKSGGTTRRYLGSFCTYTDGASVVRPMPMFQASGGRYHYVWSAVSEMLIPPLTTLTTSGGSVADTETIDLSDWVPPHARVGIVELRTTMLSGEDAIDLWVLEGGIIPPSAGREISFVDAPRVAGPSVEAKRELTVFLSTSREFTLYAATAGGGGCTVDTHPLGWIERDTRG